MMFENVRKHLSYTGKKITNIPEGVSLLAIPDLEEIESMFSYLSVAAQAVGMILPCSVVSYQCLMPLRNLDTFKDLYTFALFLS